MHVASIAETFNPSPVTTRPASPAQASDQPPQTFTESLLAASRAASDTGSERQDGARSGRRQNPASDDAKSPRSTLVSRAVLSPASLPQTVQQQVPPTRQLAAIDPALVAHALKIPSAAAAPASDVAAATAPSIGSNIAQPAVAESDNPSSSRVQKHGDPSQAASTLSSAGYGSQVATNPSSLAPNPPSNVVPGDAAGSTPGVVPDVATPIALTVSGAVPPPLPEAAPTRVPVAFARAVSDTLAKAVPNLTPAVVQNPTPSVTAGAPLNAATVPVAHSAANESAKGDVAEKSTSVSANQSDQANPPAITSSSDGSAIVPSVPDATVSQLVALIQPGNGLIGPSQVGAAATNTAVAAKPSEAAVVNGKDGTGNSVTDVTGVKQYAQSAPAQPSSTPVSQGTSSGDQGQGGASQQGQNAATPQGNFPNHVTAAVDHAQNPGTAVLSPAAPPLAGTSDHSSKAAQTGPPATVVVPQAAPVINTAKLIQSIGQSEMRVGMRSSDFGNISISTSATRNLISAQISLEHVELARTLATHLPEMQARLGGAQAMNVRIDTNGQQAGQSAETSTGMSNGSADQSHGGRQQKGGAPSTQSVEGFGHTNSMPAPVLPSADGTLDARLDIRV